MRDTCDLATLSHIPQLSHFVITLKEPSFRGKAAQLETSTSLQDNSWGNWTLEDYLVQIPAPLDQKAIQMSYRNAEFDGQIYCLETGSFTFSQILPLKTMQSLWRLSWTRLWIRTWKHVYSTRLAERCKLSTSSSNSPPHPTRVKFKSPTPRNRKMAKCPGKGGGGVGMLKVRIDWRINTCSVLYSLLSEGRYCA